MLSRATSSWNNIPHIPQYHLHLVQHPVTINYRSNALYLLVLAQNRLLCDVPILLVFLWPTLCITGGQRFVLLF